MLPSQQQGHRQWQWPPLNSSKNTVNNSNNLPHERRGPARSVKCCFRQATTHPTVTTHHLRPQQHLVSSHKLTEQTVNQLRLTRAWLRPSGTHQHHHLCPSFSQQTPTEFSVICAWRTVTSFIIISVNFVIIVWSLPVKNCDFAYLCKRKSIIIGKLKISHIPCFVCEYYLTFTFL